MNAKDVVKLIDLRMEELSDVVAVQYYEDVKGAREEDGKKMKKAYESVRQTLIKAGFEDRIRDYQVENCLNAITFPELERIKRGELAKIKKDGEMLKKRIIIMGLKDGGVKDLLLKYLKM